MLVPKIEHLVDFPVDFPVDCTYQWDTETDKVVLVRGKTVGNGFWRDPDRFLARTYVNGYMIGTVYMSIGFTISGEHPAVFETMVFQGFDQLSVDRECSYSGKEALEVHKSMVDKYRGTGVEKEYVVWLSRDQIRRLNNMFHLGLVAVGPGLTRVTFTSTGLDHMIYWLRTSLGRSGMKIGCYMRLLSKLKGAKKRSWAK